MDSAYTIVPYEPRLRDGVVRVLRHLLGDDDDDNRAYFRWKYEDNPFRQAPPGVVALHDDTVVGFRGYFATRWAVANGDSFLVLGPGDTCVSPDHRRQGLSVALGEAALATCATGARLLLNTSSSANSVSGYQKLGFVPVVARSYLHRYSLPRLGWYLAATKLGIGTAARLAAGGPASEIVVSDTPDGEAMARVAAASRSHAALGLVRDTALFNWRFRNPKSRYLFYFLRSAGSVAAYVVLRFRVGGRRGFVIDYAERAPGLLSRLLTFMTKTGHADVLSVWSCGMGPDARTLFESSGFRTGGLMTAIDRRMSGQRSILVRPVAAELAESDWLVHGLDAREASNWRFFEIGSDAA